MKLDMKKKREKRRGGGRGGEGEGEGGNSVVEREKIKRTYIVIFSLEDHYLTLSLNFLLKSVNFTIFF